MPEPRIHNLTDLISATTGAKVPPPPQKPPSRSPERRHRHSTRRRSWLKIATICLIWGYLAVVILVAAIVHLAGDLWWPATVMTFSPRWIILAPLPILFVAALIAHRRSLAVLAIAAAVGIGPVMGFCVPWRSAFGASPTGRLVLRVVTLNIGGGIDEDALAEFLKEVNPDVVALQECPDSITIGGDSGDEWHIARHSDLLIASRLPIVKTVGSPASAERDESPAMRCEILTDVGIVGVHALHLYTPRDGLEAMLWDGSRGVSELLRVTTVRSGQSQIAARFAGDSRWPAIILGDFNTTADSAIFRRDWSHWLDAFSIRGFGFGYTFAAGPIGVRIDHVLADAVHWRVASCYVGPDLRGQHRPVAAELVLLDTAD